MAERSKACVCGHSLPETAGLNPAEVMDVSLVSDMSSQVEVSATGRSLIQTSHTERRESEYDLETPIIRRPWPTGAVDP